MKKINKIILELYSDRKQILFLAFLASLEYLTRDLVTITTGVQYATMGWIAVGTAVIGGAAKVIASTQNAKIAEAAATDARIEREKQQTLLEEQKDKYRSMKFENVFADMENVYEDLTVNQQQAEFQQQQGDQQRANIMQSLKGAAGGSGIAGLAQMLANQGQLQTQRISASIGQQEARNQLLAAQGAGAVQAAELGGEQWVQEAKMSRQATLLGMQFGATSGANLASAQAQANQMQAQMAQNEAWASGISGVASAIGSADFGSARQANPDLTSGVGEVDENEMVTVFDRITQKTKQVPASERFNY